VVIGAAKPKLVWRITCDYLLAMFDTYLKSKTPSPLLDGSEKPYLQVVVGGNFFRSLSKKTAFCYDKNYGIK
jgi:hypothetical protein